ncbi:hypothetical protein [Actinoallomurus liliacearum]
MPHLVPETGPQRVIAASNFVNTIGSGLYLTAGVLYFTQAAHLPATEVGLGLGIAGFVSLIAGVTVGHLADTHGARGVYAATLVVRGAATASGVPRLSARRDQHRRLPRGPAGGLGRPSGHPHRVPAPRRG